MKRVYIAGPLSTGGSYSGTVLNVQNAIDAADLVLMKGGAPFCPHLSHYWNLHYFHTWDEWMALDRAWIEVSHVVWRLPGESKGADQEVQWANELGIPVITTLTEMMDYLAKNP